MASEAEYAKIAREAGQRLEDQLVAVLDAYANPVASSHPAACIYKRTFAPLIRDVLIQQTVGGLETMVQRLNTVFDQRVRGEISVTGDFHAAIMGLRNASSDVNFDIHGDGPFITVRDEVFREARPELPIAPARPPEEQALMNELSQRLFDALLLPAIQLDEFRAVQDACDGQAFSYRDILHMRQPETGGTLLHACVVSNRPDQVAAMERIGYLISHGLSVNERDKDARTPLLRASLLGIEELVDFLRAKGAAIDVEDSQGYVPEDFMRFQQQRCAGRDLRSEMKMCLDARHAGPSVSLDENPTADMMAVARAFRERRSCSRDGSVDGSVGGSAAPSL